jgi:hypothetical protein
MIDTLSLDYETASDLDLTKVGLDRYSADPSTRVLMGAYRINGGVLQHWEAHRCKVPTELREALEASAAEITRWAFNSQFERVITNRVLGIKSPIKGWRCSMCLAYMESFTGGLAEVCEQIGLPHDKQKSKEGKRLIRLFSMPQRVTRNQPHLWRNWITDGDLWQEFCEYNKQDVIAEEAVKDRLIRYPISESEWSFFHLDQIINDRGIPVDMDFIDNVIWMSARRKAELTVRMQKLTGLTNPNSTQQLLPWLQERGYPYNDLQKESVSKALKQDIDCKTVLRLRQWASRTSTSKAIAAKLVVGEGNRARYLFQFGGASRTNRFSGRLIQSQNMMRTPKILDDNVPKLSFVTDLIRTGDYDGLELVIGEPMLALTGCMRGLFRAPEGQEFITGDVIGAESVGLGYLARCERLLNVFREGRDPYKDFGMEFYNKPYDAITKEERGICKPPTLGCLGSNTLILTTDGWRRIIDIHKFDKVFDGTHFVEHGGLIYQGLKSVIDLNGVSITPDHEILCGEDKWQSAEAVFLNTRLGRKAIDSATGGLLNQFEKQKVPSIIGANVTGVARSKTFMHKIWNLVKHGVVFRAPMNELGERKMEFISVLKLVVGPPIDWQTDIMQLSLAAEVSGSRRTDTKVEGSSVVFPMSMSLLPIASRLKVLKIQLSGLIAQTTMDITRRGIYGLLRPFQAAEIKSAYDGSHIEVKLCALSNSGNATPLHTESVVRWPERFVRGYLRNKLLRTKRIAEVPTYDLLNCGPRNRFMILTNRGPIIVHNCGYRLSGGEVQKDGSKTGLMAYAENMGVLMSRDEAHRAVRIFRQTYPEIEQFWYDCENAIRFVLRTHKPFTVGYLTFEWMKPYLLIRLPSGRYLYYYKPRLERREFSTGRIKNGVEETYTRIVFTYMGRNQKNNQWTRLQGHGGVIVENVVQAMMTRDVLKVYLTRLHKAGFKIVGHSHDEGMALCRLGDDRFTLARMLEIMKEPIEWAPGLPLGATGWHGQFYRK